MIEVKVPGKLYIAGEYAVVSPGHKAIVMSVDKFITIRLKKSNNSGSIKSYSNIKMIWSREGDEIIVEQKNDRFEYILSAMNITERFLLEKGYMLDFYDIEVMSDLESKDGLKYGLGSSASIVVAVIKALLDFYGENYTKLELFKLAVLSTLSLNISGSCGDLAAVVFNGLIKYTSFDRKAIFERLNNEKINNIVNSEWELLDIKKIKLNDKFKFIIGWTKSPASSYNLVKHSRKNLKKHMDFYKSFLLESEECVELFEKAYIDSDFNKIRESIEKNRKLLNLYAENFNIEIEKNNLSSLIEISKSLGLASKSSGAGGGDCGLAICEYNFDINKLKFEWQMKDIDLLDLNVYEGLDE